MDRLFKGYEKAHLRIVSKGVPQASGKMKVDYETVHSEATPAVFEAHLKGTTSIGVSPLRVDGTVTWGAIDLDLYKLTQEDVNKIMLAFKGTMGALFRSKSRGLHFYVFLSGVNWQPERRDAGRFGDRFALD